MVDEKKVLKINGEEIPAKPGNRKHDELNDIDMLIHELTVGGKSMAQLARDLSEKLGKKVAPNSIRDRIHRHAPERLKEICRERSFHKNRSFTRKPNG